MSDINKRLINPKPEELAAAQKQLNEVLKLSPVPDPPLYIVLPYYKERATPPMPNLRWLPAVRNPSESTKMEPPWDADTADPRPRRLLL